jgi:ATP-binding cassette, subfamily B, bacterial
MKRRTRSVDLQTLGIYFKENWRYKGLFIGTAAAWLTGMALQKLAAAIIAAKALDRLIEVAQHPGGNYVEIFWPYVFGVIVVGVAALGLIDLGLILLSKLETKVRPELRTRVFDFLTDQSLQFHANTFSGALVTQANRFTTAYVAITDNFVINILRMFTTVVIATFIIAFYSLPIALFMLSWVAFFTVLNVHLTRKRAFLSRRAAAAESVATAHLADSMGNIGVIKAFAREKTEHNTHADLGNDQAQKKYESWMRSIKNDFFHGALMVLLQAVVLAMSVAGVLHNKLSIGTLLLIQVYVAQLIGELWGLSNMSRSIEQNLADAAEMTEILNQPTDIVDPAKPKKLHVAKGVIDFDHVNFTHADNKSDDTLFEEFNLRIASGEKIGLVGHSGSGKTTLTKLLLRFVDTDGGTITIDGQSIRDVRQADLRSQIAYVPQEPLLFHRSLSENIAYGKPEATDKEVHAAARKARAAEFIDNLPKGYETLVGERGVKLSGGQRQRIAIARAILKDAPILVLDEATSALDSESEVLIQQALWELMEGRTAIVIAHRLSTIQKMDRIVVMEDGAIIEQGTHKELLKKKGTYARLWAHQSGGFLEE